jgi:hypothetical protein
MARHGVIARLAFLLLLVAPDVVHARPAAPQSRLETAVKANYLIRFAAFVSWPASAFATSETPIAICVLGPDPFGATLDRAAVDQTAHGRRIVIRRPPSMEAATGCHILYLGAAAGGRAPPRALVVTDANVGDARGALHFVVSEGRVRFHIDLRAAGQQGLTLNSRLLNLALTVQGSPR